MTPSIITSTSIPLPSSFISNNQNRPSPNSDRPLSSTNPRHPSNHLTHRLEDNIPLVSHRLSTTDRNTNQQPNNSSSNDNNNSFWPIFNIPSSPSSSSSPSTPRRARLNHKPKIVKCKRPVKIKRTEASSSSTSTAARKRKAVEPISPTLSRSIKNPKQTSIRPKKRRSSEVVSTPKSNSSQTPILISEMVFQSHINYLSAKVQVVFENEGVLDMLGGPNTGTSYSLPGHVILSLPALPAFLEGRLREVKDLKLVMEGKSEFWDDHGRYTPMRLHTTTLSLATPSNPLLLPSHDPSRPHAQRIQLAVAFDMRLPGWLPPSHDSEMTTISYGVIAQATVGWTEPASKTYATPSNASSSSSSTSSSSSDFSMESVIPFKYSAIKNKSTKPFDAIFGNHSLLAKSIQKSDSKWSPFSIQRHRLPSAIGAFAQDRTERHFTLKPEADSTSPVECVVTVPDWVDVNGEEKSLKVSLRVRARKNAIQPSQAMDVDSPESSSSRSSTTNTSSEGGSRELESVPMERQGGSEKKAVDEMLTHILELGMEVEEIERYSSTPSQSFTSSFPLPTEQPSRNSSQHQLISPRMNYAEGGFLGYDDKPFKGMRTRQCLLSDDGNQRNFFFSDKGLGLGEKWRKVNVVLPMPNLESLKSSGSQSSSSSRPQPEMDSPFLRIRHDLKIRVVCRNAGSSEDAQVVILSTPIKFGTCPSTVPTTKPKPAPLPAYIQLFHENGDLRECDALPIYTKSEQSSSQANSPVDEIPSISIPNSPTPTYASLYPLTTRPCSSRSPSPIIYQDDSSSSNSRPSSPSSNSSLLTPNSNLDRRERSSSPSPSNLSNESIPMDIDSIISSSDEDESRISTSTNRTSSSTTSSNSNQTSRKIARTIPRAVRVNA